MKTLAQFKAEHNVTSITFSKGKGREFATIGNIDIVISSKTDTTKPLYVIPMGLGEGIEGVRENCFVIINSSVTEGQTL